MKKSGELERIEEEVEDHYEDNKEKHFIKLIERKNTVKDIKEDDASWSEEEIQMPSQNIKDHSVLNLEKIVEALEILGDGLKAPLETPIEIRSIENNLSQESDVEIYSDNEEKNDEKLVIHATKDFGEDVISKWIREQSPKKSPGKKEEEYICREALEELERLTTMQNDEELKMNKHKMTLRNLKNSKKQMNEQSSLYEKDIKFYSDEKMNEKFKFQLSESELNKYSENKIEDQRLLVQHKQVCENYYKKKLMSLRNTEENLSMKYEELLVDFCQIKESNLSLRSTQKKIKKISKLTSELEDQREKNEYYIQNYSLVLKSISKHMQNRENIDFSKRVSEISLKISSLQTSIDDFTKEALEDPRKLIPYIRSATPNKTQNMFA